MSDSKKVCVIGGAGYVGLITGLGLAELGNEVINVDVDQEKNKMLNNGESPIYEENIEEMLERNLEEERITFTDEIKKGIKESEIIYIAVGTPEKEDGQADLSYVIDVAEKLRDNIDSYKVIVLKSTVPVGTDDTIKNILRRELEVGEDFDIVANPEFLREGKGLKDFFNPQRIVLGSDSSKALKKMKELYEPLLDDTPLVETDPASAQMIKYASNTFLANRVSFINEIANLCERIGADINDVTEGMGYDDRIGHEYLDPGAGFGGPCLSKDLKALIKIGENVDYEPRFLKAIYEKNQHQIREVVKKIKEMVGYPLYKKVIGVYGLAFKPGTNDVRDSVALEVIKRLKKEGVEIKAYDPKAVPEAKREVTEISYHNNPYEVAENTELIVMLTAWPEFKELDFEKIKDKMVEPRVLDAENVFNNKEIRKLDFEIKGIGK